MVEKITNYLINLGFTSADELKILELYSGTLSREEIKGIMELLYEFEKHMEKNT